MLDHTTASPLLGYAIIAEDSTAKTYMDNALLHFAKSSKSPSQFYNVRKTQTQLVSIKTTTRSYKLVSKLNL